MDDITQMAQDLTSQGWSLSDKIAPHDICRSLLTELLSKKDQNLFAKSRIGRADGTQMNANIRGDFISWLDPLTPQEAEKKFFDWFNHFIKELNHHLLLGLQDFELHYAFYPPKTLYQKHLDVFQTSSTRKISFVLYLNESWGASDGGELILYEEKNPELEAARIPPMFGRLVLFLSDAIYHQVNFTNRERFSVTGWLKNRV